MRGRPLLALALAAAFTLVGTSCLSPTLPLPPPEADSIVQTVDGRWTIAGSCNTGAIVTVFNQTQGQGMVIEDRDLTGRFVVKLQANLCDVGWIAQQVVGEEPSESAGFVVEPRAPTDTGSSTICK
jgi:hypothetical protein